MALTSHTDMILLVHLIGFSNIVLLVPISECLVYMGLFLRSMVTHTTVGVNSAGTPSTKLVLGKKIAKDANIYYHSQMKSHVSLLALTYPIHLPSLT